MSVRARVHQPDAQARALFPRLGVGLVQAVRNLSVNKRFQPDAKWSNDHGPSKKKEAFAPWRSLFTWTGRDFCLAVRKAQIPVATKRLIACSATQIKECSTCFRRLPCVRRRSC